MNYVYVVIYILICFIIFMCLFMPNELFHALFELNFTERNANINDHLYEPNYEFIFRPFHSLILSK
jgi:hypothetical protein